MLLADMKPGMVLAYFYDTGAFGTQMRFARVIRVGKARVTVEGEDRQTASVSPDRFHRAATPDEFGDYRPDWLAAAH